MTSQFVAATTDVALFSAPIHPEWIISGSPVASAKLLDTSADGLAFTVVWECTPGSFTWRYNIDETIHILGGSILLETEGKPARRLTSGAVVAFKKGAVVRWEVEETVRKLAFCRRVTPKPLRLIMSLWDGCKALRFGAASASASAGFSQPLFGGAGWAGEQGSPAVG